MALGAKIRLPLPPRIKAFCSCVAARGPCNQSCPLRSRRAAGPSTDRSTQQPCISASVRYINRLLACSKPMAHFTSPASAPFFHCTAEVGFDKTSCTVLHTRLDAHVHTLINTRFDEGWFINTSANQDMSSWTLDDALLQKCVDSSRTLLKIGETWLHTAAFLDPQFGQPPMRALGDISYKLGSQDACYIRTSDPVPR